MKWYLNIIVIFPPIIVHYIYIHNTHTQKKYTHQYIHGSLLLTNIQKCTHFSLSPSHLDIRSEEETEKKVELLASVATALAR